MTTVVNTPSGSSSDSGSTGMIVGLILLLAFAFLFVVYGLPLLRNAAAGSASPRVTVPDKIDVNVQTPNGGNTGGGQPSGQ